MSRAALSRRCSALLLKAVTSKHSQRCWCNRKWFWWPALDGRRRSGQFENFAAPFGVGGFGGPASIIDKFPPEYRGDREIDIEIASTFLPLFSETGEMPHEGAEAV